ncbi:MAG TPA: hypothetical protein VMF89_17305 [Polyangiales bacterium]|nr:hypothetical protein [Polyangiales bacterium]
MRGWLVAALAYAALSALLCWPIVRALHTHLPLGELGEPTVPYFNLWTLLWNAERLRHGFAGYWDAPIFYPARDAFALSEPQGLTGLLFAPLALLAGPVGAYNLTLLALLVANGLAGRCLLIEAGTAAPLATWGGMFFIGLQFLREELAVLQLCATWPIVLGLCELTRLAQRADPWAIVRLAVWVVATGWSCIYYLLFFVLLIVLAGPFVVRRSWFERPMLIAMLFGTCCVAAGLVPLTAAEERAVASFTRSASAIHTGSSSALAYLQFPRDTPLAQLIPAWARPEGRRSLYPGMLLVGLAVVGGFGVGRRERRRLLAYSSAALLVCLFLSFGTRLQLAGISPYQLTAQRYLPGFDHLRSPYRGAVFVQLLLALWAGIGLASLAARLQPWAARLASAGCVLLALLEVTPWHFTRARFPHEVLHEPWLEWLRAQPEGAVAMVPVNPTWHVRDYVDTTLYMLQGLKHGHPIVNGYSGFFPPASDDMVLALRGFPGAASLEALRKGDVRYVVVDRKLDAVRTLTERPDPRLEPVYEHGPRIVYRVRE